MKPAFPTLVLFVLATAAARADQAACDRIRAANVKTGSAGGTMKATGYAFAKDTPDIYGPGEHTCGYLRDEAVDGQPAAVYREQYRSKTGSTDATIWISKSSGLLLREEQDGDVAGKGKGHISYRWTAAPARAGGSAPAGDGKLPLYPGGRNMNRDMPASAAAKGAPLVLETGDPVATVDAWYRSHAPAPCERIAVAPAVKYACPAGSVLIYPHEGKTQIAFVPAMPPTEAKRP
jgi:hypothetical protein